MEMTWRSYKVASWSMILVGIGHTITDLTTPKTAEQEGWMLEMKTFVVQIMGTTVDIFSFHQGFSLMMGLLLFGYGTLNLLILKNNGQAPLPTNILLLNCLITLVSVVLSIQYFFTVPIILTGIAFLGYSISILMQKNIT